MIEISNVAAIELLQKGAIAEGFLLPVTGVFDRSTRDAVNAYRDRKLSSAKFPRRVPSEVEAFFGRPGSNLVDCAVPFPLRLAFDPSQSITSFRCHSKVRLAFQAAFNAIWEAYNHDQAALQKDRIDLFGGCLQRPVPGKGLDLHAWGAAIDIDPERGGVGKAWKERGMLPRRVIDAFLAQGLAWGGNWQRPEARHFEASH